MAPHYKEYSTSLSKRILMTGWTHDWQYSCSTATHLANWDAILVPSDNEWRFRNTYIGDPSWNRWCACDFRHWPMISSNHFYHVKICSAVINILLLLWCLNWQWWSPIDIKWAGGPLCWQNPYRRHSLTGVQMSATEVLGILTILENELVFRVRTGKSDSIYAWTNSPLFAVYTCIWLAS